MSILMMSRRGLIELVVYDFTLVSILWKINYGNMISNKKILKYGWIVFIVFMMMFFYMRFLRGDGGQFDLVQDIFAYAGSEIPGMDAYLKGKFQFKEPYDEYVGSHTFLGLYYFCTELDLIYHLLLDICNLYFLIMLDIRMSTQFLHDTY